MSTLESIMDTVGVFLRDFFAETVKQIGIKDVIDIFLLSLVLYFIYTLVRDSRAGKLLAGLAVLLVISLVSDFFGLRALGFILGDFHQIIIIVVLILFQPELRTALEKVGGTPLTGIKSMGTDSNELATLNAEIDAICTAVNDLSRDKVGALIVIERSTKLGEFVKSGVYVDAAISPYILRNIFFNKAPLHDGAVIIRNSRICAAGCFLPLSTKEDINKDLGTRHRAAIGLTEISDALVIVVSEENGIVSLSRDGNLERNFNYNSLKQELVNCLTPQNAVDNAINAIEKNHKKHGKSKKAEDE